MQIEDQTDIVQQQQNQQYQDQSKQEDNKKSDFETQLLEYQPDFIKKDYLENNVVLMNGINYDNLSKTEIAYFLSKKPLPQQKRKIIEEENIKPKFPTSRKNIDEQVPINGNSNKAQERKELLVEREDQQKQFCICKQAGEKEEEMASCDNCKEWFHPLCLKISKIQMNNIMILDNSRWYCNRCMNQNTELNSIDNQYKQFINIQNTIMYQNFCKNENFDYNKLNLYDLSFMYSQQKKFKNNQIEKKYFTDNVQNLKQNKGKKNDQKNFKNVYQKIKRIQKCIKQQKMGIFKENMLNQITLHNVCFPQEEEQVQQEVYNKKSNQKINQEYFNLETDQKIPQLSFTLGQFPDEIDPIDFFSQKQTSFQDFIDYLGHNYMHSEVLQIYFWNYNQQLFFQPFEVKATSKISTKVYYLTMSASYFLISCSDLTQLCFSNRLLQYILQNNLKKKFISNKIFLRVLEKILNPQRPSLHHHIKKSTRKSIFHNNKNNFVFGEQQTDHVCDQNSSNTLQKQTRTSILNNKLVNKQTTKSQSNFDKIKSEIISEISEESQTNSSNSESESSSSSDSETSFEEEEYETNNPFQILYQKLQFKSFDYKITTNKPNIIDLEGNVTYCQPEEIYRYLSTF